MAILIHLFYINFKKLTFFFLRERICARAGEEGRKRGRKRDHLQALPVEHIAPPGIDLRSLRSRLELKSGVQCLTNWFTYTTLKIDIFNVTSLSLYIYMCFFFNTIACTSHLFKPCSILSLRLYFTFRFPLLFIVWNRTLIYF